MLQWEDLLQIAGSIALSNDEDAIIWKFNSNGKYSVQSLYAVLSFRGVSPVHIPAVWKLNIPLGSTFSFGYYTTISCLLETIYKKGEMWLINLACFVVKMRLLPTYFSIAVLPI